MFEVLECQADELQGETFPTFLKSSSPTSTRRQSSSSDPRSLQSSSRAVRLSCTQQEGTVSTAPCKPFPVLPSCPRARCLP